jgi:hypothetical protein
MKTRMLKLLVLAGSLAVTACAGQRNEEKATEVSTVVTSSVIERVSYHYGTRILTLHFRSGHVYEYEDIAPALFLEFLDAPSKGAFYAHRIRGWHDSRRVDIPAQYQDIARSR